MSRTLFLSHHEKRCLPSMFASGLAVIAFLSLLSATSSAQADDVVRVEEDWELVLEEPSSDEESPQVVTTMSPFNHLDSFYTMATWNYREFPDFTPGGIQLQAWSGKALVHKHNYNSAALTTDFETITWTQELSTDGDSVTFRIKNGNSDTWGVFGGSDTKVSGMFDVPNLNDYHTGISVARSGINFGANRVTRLQIKAVRRYAADGTLISNDTTPKIVHEIQDD